MHGRAAREVLTRAASLVRAGWRQEGFAADEEGCSVHIGDPRACSFCVSGAIRRASVDLRYDTDPYVVGLEACLAFRALREAIGIEVMDITAWNDAPRRTREEVVAVLDEAIGSLE